jgi:hypothetical protein
MQPAKANQTIIKMGARLEPIIENSLKNGVTQTALGRLASADTKP